jgi:hypothetical protein
MIKCIINSIDEVLLNKLMTVLTKEIKMRWPNAEITIKKSHAYWKNLEDREVIFNIANNFPIRVFDCIKLFDLNWDYLEDPTVTSEEDAVWSKLCYPNEIFLTEQVKWVHIYTWRDRKIAFKEDPSSTLRSLQDERNRKA